MLGSNLSYSTRAKSRGNLRLVTCLGIQKRFPREDYDSFISPFSCKLSLAKSKRKIRFVGLLNVLIL